MADKYSGAAQNVNAHQGSIGGWGRDLPPSKKNPEDPANDLSNATPGNSSEVPQEPGSSDDDDGVSLTPLAEARSRRSLRFPNFLLPKHDRRDDARYAVRWQALCQCPRIHPRCAAVEMY